MRVVERGYVDAVRNLEVTLRSLGGGSKEKMQEDWESIDLKKCLFSCTSVYSVCTKNSSVLISPGSSSLNVSANMAK